MNRIAPGDRISTVIAETLRRGRSRAHRDPISLFESHDDALAAVEEKGKQDDASPSKDNVALQKGDVSSEDITDKLNSIRAGRSLRDPEIKHNIDKYVNDLNKAERTALLAYLKGIEQIVSGQVVADKAVEPRDPDPSVQMKKTTSDNVRKIKPTIVKNSTHGGHRASTSGEDTAPPLPVKVKK